MTASLLSKYARRPGDQAPDEPATLESDGTDDLGCFGFLRGVRERAVMLELRKKDGSMIAIGYAYIERIVYIPDGAESGITLHGAGQKIRISGRNLGANNRSGVRLFEALTRHRVPWVRESDRPSLVTGDDSAAVVDSIEW